MRDNRKTKDQLIQDLNALRDENQRLIAEMTVVKEQESSSREILDSLQEVVFELDLEGNILYYNKRSYDFFGHPTGVPKHGTSVMDSVAPRDRQKMRENMADIIKGRISGVSEYRAIKADGTEFPVMIHSVPIIRNGVPVGLRGTIMDITERVRINDQLKYLNAHDPLTGVYNRLFFEQEMLHLSESSSSSTGLIICDLDGLKLVNDTLGHESGDILLKAAADVIKECFAGSYFIARIGGDEFAVLLTDCTEEILVNEVHRLRLAINYYNGQHPELILNLSIGYNVSDGKSIDPNELFKRADNVMYREKLHRSQSVRSNLVQTLLKALEARDIITEQHAERMEGLIQEFARNVGVAEHRFNDLRLFAHFHDIGKVGISDKILQKPGKLTPEERREMQNHCDIGHRIALSSPDLLPIADWILKHHEWWNGQGYPMGLAGTEIPLECRLLNIIDAFDAMTSDRPYRKAMPVEKALEELKACAGTQFEPDLVQAFVKKIENQQ